MTHFVVTNQLRDALKKSGYEFQLDVVDHEDLIQIYTRYKPTNSLLDLVRLSKMKIDNKNESLKDRPKSPEFIKSMELLRLKQREEEYQRLVKSVPKHDTIYEEKIEDAMTPAMAHKELKNQTTTIFNILISVASVVYAIWYWSSTSMNLEMGLRVLLCLFFGLLVLVAEVVVYMGYLNKIEEAKIRERNKKEVKKVIRSLN